MAAINGVKITPEGEFSRFESTTETFLEDLYTAIDCRMVEVVGTPALGMFESEEFSFWVDEEGLMVGEPIYNSPATTLVWDRLPATKSYLRLHGTAVVTGGTGPEGESLGLTEGEIILLIGFGNASTEAVKTELGVSNIVTMERA